MRISAIDRDLDEYFYFDPPGRPLEWDGTWVKARLVHAFTVERKIPGRPGPALLRNTWRLATLDSFSDRVAQGEAPRRELYARWARAAGATAHEVSLMEEAFGWLPQALCNGRVVEGKCLLCWAHSQAGGPPLRRTIRMRGWSRSTFLRRVEGGAEAIANHLRARDVPLR
jgi:hypothetical protein